MCVCVCVCLCVSLYLSLKGRHATWADNPLHETQRLTKIPVPGMRNLPEIAGRVAQVTLQTVQNIAVALGCLSEVEGKLLLPKTPHT